MNICVDVGNTSVKIGLFKDNVLLKQFSFATDVKQSEDELEARIKNLLHFENEEDNFVIYSSVVPSIDICLKRALKAIFHPKKFYSLADKIKTGVAIKTDNPSEVGADLIADIAGAKDKYGYPVIVCDLGTASKILLIDKDAFFSSAIIAPGISVSAKALAGSGELLPNIGLVAPNKVIARNTHDAMNVGVLLGHVEMLKGLVRRTEEELGYKCQHILTGGGALYIKHLMEDDFVIDEHLALDGLNIILNRNLDK